MNGWVVTTYVRRGIPVALACAVALLSGSTAVRAEDPTEDQIRDQLLRGHARGAHFPAATAEPARDSNVREILLGLAQRTPRTITEGIKKELGDLIIDKPSIDLEVTFEYNSAVIGPSAVPTLVKLGRVLGSAELNGNIFVISGYTDAAGSDSYNQSLSERRAEAVKTYLAAQFGLSPGQLVAVGYGKSHLKNTVNPLAAENRRVQIVNTEQPAAVSQK